MILPKTFFFASFIAIGFCLPSQNRLNLNNLPPEDVNSLEAEEPQPSASIEHTVKEVEALLAANPKLPRLTRGEILDILDNITKEDYQKKRDGKAIMVVMPFTPSKGKDMEELFTKPPVTHIIGNDEDNKKVESTEKYQEATTRRRRPSTTTTRRPLRRRTTSSTTVATTKHPNHRYPEQMVGNSGIRIVESPKLATKNTIGQNDFGTTPSIEVSAEHIEEIQDNYFNKPLLSDSLILSHQDEFKPSSIQEVVDTPIKRPPEGGQYKKRPLGAVPRPKVVITTKRPEPVFQNVQESSGVAQEASSKRAPTSKRRPVGNAAKTVFKIPSEVGDSAIISVQNKFKPFEEQFKPFEVHQDPFKPFEEHQDQFQPSPSQKFADPAPKRPPSSTKYPKTPVGAVAEPSKLPQNEAMISEILPDNLKKLVKDLDLETALHPKPSPLPSLKDHNKIHSMFTALGIDEPTTQVPDAESVAENLSPEMRDLLKSFGLLPNTNPPKPQIDSYNPETAEIHPESYLGFKPLPEEGSSRNDMEELLAQFGLGRSGRKNKALDHKGLNFDMVPEHLRHVITDLGIEESRRTEKKIRNSTPKQHVFNPDEQYATEDELKKLEQLLGMIKQLEKLNGTATEEDLKRINLTNFVETLNTTEKVIVDQMDLGNVTLDHKGPDPNNFGEDSRKNEVKRQEVTTTVASVSTEIASVSTESPNGPIKDLEASFGGVVSASAAPVETTTEGIRTGFYYLVDWNTFLDIDDTKGRRVNLRFQPKIGDPKRFLSVTVP